MNIQFNLDLKNIDEEIHKLDILDRDTIIQLYVLSLKRIDKLNNIIKKIEKYIDEELEEFEEDDDKVIDEYNMECLKEYIQELKEKVNE